MEPPPSPPLMAKKLANMVCKFMIKRGKVIGRALNDVVLQQHDALIGCHSHDMHTSFVSPAPLSCQSQDIHTSFVSPTALSCKSHDDVHPSYLSPRKWEYEFSCSNSSSHPPYNPLRASKAKTHGLRKYEKRYYKHKIHNQAPSRNSRSEWCPLVGPVMDSPSYTRDYDHGDDYFHIDLEAERFIERFYMELRLQKWLAAPETADYYYS